MKRCGKPSLTSSRHWLRVVYDFEMDPLNIVGPAGSGIRGAAADMATGPLGRRILGTGADLVGRVLEAPDRIFEVPLRGLGAVGRGVGTVPIVHLAIEKLKHPILPAAVERAVSEGRQVVGDISRRFEGIRDDLGGPLGPSAGPGDVPPVVPDIGPNAPRGPVSGVDNTIRQADADMVRVTDTTVPVGAVPAEPGATINDLIRRAEVDTAGTAPPTIAEMLQQADTPQIVTPGGATPNDPFANTSLGREVRAGERPDWDFASPRDNCCRMVDERVESPCRSIRRKLTPLSCTRPEGCIAS